jgi:hypothetical protein
MRYLRTTINNPYNMNKVRVIEFHPKMRQPGMWAYKERFFSAKVVCMTITEDEATNTEAWGKVWQEMLRTENVNMKFIVVPNGAFLPVPVSHYLTNY